MILSSMTSVKENFIFNKLNNRNFTAILFLSLVEIDNVTMYVFDLNLIRRTEKLYAVSLHFYKRRTRWPISYSINEIYSSHRLSSLSAQIQLESDVFGWQSFPIGDVIQRQINYLSGSKRSEYFGITLKPTVTTRTQRRNIVDLDKFSIYTPFLIVYSKDSKEGNVFEEFVPKNFEQDIKSFEAYENEVNQRNNRYGRAKKQVDLIVICFFFFFRSLRRSIESNLDSTNLLSNWNVTIPTQEPDLCSVKPFVLDFSDLGFSSRIFESRNFMAHLCSGSCQAKVSRFNLIHPFEIIMFLHR